MPLSSLLSKHRVHLLAGASDAGKTSFILPAMVAWNPAWVYVNGDRSDEDAHDKFVQLGLTPASIPYISNYGATLRTWPKLIELIRKMEPQPEYIVYEGFQRRCTRHNEPSQVFEYMAMIDSLIKPSKEIPLGLTVLGICESPKQKPREKYPDPRWRVSGCTAWVSHASTVFLVEPLDKDPTSLKLDRQLWVCPKNSQRRCLVTKFDAKGNLVFPNL